MNRDQKIRKHIPLSLTFPYRLRIITDRIHSLQISFSLHNKLIQEKEKKNLKNISGLHHSNLSSLFLTTPSAVSSAYLDLLQRSSYDILWRTFVAITNLHLRPRRPTSDIGVDFLHYIGALRLVPLNTERHTIYVTFTGKHGKGSMEQNHQVWAKARHLVDINFLFI